jgi:hypothetical protein
MSVTSSPATSSRRSARKTSSSAAICAIMAWN